MPDVFGSGFLGGARLAQPSSTGKRWWLHHISSTRAYLEAAMAGDQNHAVAAVLELWNAILEWQGIAGKPAAVLMAEHTALAKLLVDCFAQAQRDACPATAAAALGRNVDAQGILFPKDPAGFANLFGEHVRITGDYIAAYAAGDFAAFQASYQKALANGEELGRFTDRNFFGRT